MKKIQPTRLRPVLLAITLTTLLTACRDDFTLDSLDVTQKLVVYCFPTPQSDTTFIDIARSQPVSSRPITPTPEAEEDVRITYQLNGTSLPVSYHKTGHRYYVVASHQPGDRVDVEVSADGLSTVSSVTTVPEAVPVELLRVVDAKVYDSDTYSAYDTDQLQAVFTDPATTTDYYAVRVHRKCYEREYIYSGSGLDVGTWTIVDSMYVYPELNTRSEPLLHPLSDLDEDFGYEANFYEGLYLFTDETINGQTYTLHLNVSPYYASAYEGPYQVFLYRLTPEYYRYLKSLNDLENNDLATIGFSQIAPTYTNVSRGIGLVGAYNRSETLWKQKE